jgi:hypothetical protein
MAAKYTKNALIHDIAEINSELAASGSSYLYKVLPRNGNCAVDIYQVNTLGQSKILNVVECGSPTLCLETVRDQFRNYSGQPTEVALKTALTAYTIIGSALKFSNDFESLNRESQALISTWRNSCVFTGTDKDFYEVLQDIDKSAELSRNAQAGQSKSI